MKNKFTQKAAALLMQQKSTQSRPHCAPTAVHDRQSSPALLLYRHLQIMKR